MLDSALSVKLIIVGDGMERDSLLRLAEARDVAGRVHFTGHIEAVETVLGLFDVFALSSDTEQMPNAVLQAMAAGRAIAAVDVGDVKAMVAPDNKTFIVAKAQPGHLTTALDTLLRSTDLRARVGRSNRQWVEEHYSQAAMFRAYQALYDDTTE